MDFRERGRSDQEDRRGRRGPRGPRAYPRLEPSQSRRISLIRRLRPLPRLRRRAPDPRWITGLVVGLGAILTLGWIGRTVAPYWPNFALNTAADLIGAVFTIYVITPIIERAGQGGVREHAELDYSQFLANAARANSVIRILDTYSNLLAEPHAARFEAMVRQAVARGVSIRVLLINPTTMAAEQRDLELGRADELGPMLERNLETITRLHRSFEQEGGPRALGSAADFQVRLYSSGPDVTMYRWDDRALVSFYPVGKLSGRAEQLEVMVDSPLGSFVNNRFQAVWHAAAPHQALTPVTVTDDNIERTYLVRFVDLEDGRRYVASRRVERFLRRSVGEVLAANDGRSCRLESAERDQVGAVLDSAFRRIYGEIPDTAYLLLRTSDPSVPGVR
ncbi:hypothetical protein [Catenulispora pinisilvae]|uniref:hypothetical protein n=1 Tax=Catenulispora pinisilvae TaxID=2705253 RepID=UPI001891D60B|nr:hypothetical protein [Catenulispora pinisilvae]